MARPRRSPRQIATALKQLSAKQDELAVQNDELTRAHDLLEESRERLAELYDFAPNGYLTLDREGVILQINLTGCLMFGRSRQQLEGSPMLGLVDGDTRRDFLEFLRRCRAGDRREISAELTIRTPDGPRPVQLLCRQRTDVAGQPVLELLTAMIDISERRELEVERAKAALDHAALASRLLSAQDEERQRIARDLHDNVGQQVTALRLMLQAALLGAQKGEVRTRIARAQTIVEHLDRQLEFLTDELRPASLDLGIASAIEQFVNEWSTTFAIEAITDCGGMEAVAMDREAETHVYRVLQEALNNVSKHAQASHVRVKMEQRGTEYVLTVADDGRGFSPRKSTGDQGRGLGLLSMRERAQLLRGRVDISSEPGKGTTISLYLPIADRTESR